MQLLLLLLLYVQYMYKSCSVSLIDSYLIHFLTKQFSSSVSTTHGHTENVRCLHTENCLSPLSLETTCLWPNYDWRPFDICKWSLYQFLYLND